MDKKENLDELQITMSNFALDIAKAFKIELDFSSKSIKNVEKILSLIHYDYIKGNITEGIDGIALEFAFYIISVIEKNFEEGKIERNHKDFGDNAFPYYWKDSVIFPYAWCQKRIYDGIADNVWVKYKRLILGYSNRTSFIQWLLNKCKKA